MINKKHPTIFTTFQVREPTSDKYWDSPRKLGLEGHILIQMLKNDQNIDNLVWIELIFGRDFRNQSSQGEHVVLNLETQRSEVALTKK